MSKVLTYTDVSKQALEEFKTLQSKSPRTPKPYLILEVIEKLKGLTWQRKYPELPPANEIRNMIDSNARKKRGSENENRYLPD